MLISLFKSLVASRQLRRLKQQGLEIADGCRLMDLPDFGSEPFLISIGKHVTISSQVSFINHDGGTWVFRHQPRMRHVIRYGRIVIHENCFIGHRAILLPGIEVGPNSVIATGAVVSRSVPPNCVAGGVPAKVLKTVEDYAQSSLARTPEYDQEAYSNDKVRELLRLYPRPW